MRWTGTGAYLIGMMMTALNIYPLNLLFGAVGGLLWFIVGMGQVDRALMVVEGAAFGIYLFGLLHWAFL